MLHNKISPFQSAADFTFWWKSWGYEKSIGFRAGHRSGTGVGKEKSPFLLFSWKFMRRQEWRDQEGGRLRLGIWKHCFERATVPTAVEQDVRGPEFKSQTREFLVFEMSKCLDCSWGVRYGSVMTEGGSESYGFPLFCVQRCGGVNGNWLK